MKVTTGFLELESLAHQSNTTLPVSIHLTPANLAALRAKFGDCALEDFRGALTAEIANHLAALIAKGAFILEARAVHAAGGYAINSDPDATLPRGSRA